MIVLLSIQATLAPPFTCWRFVDHPLTRPFMQASSRSLSFLCFLAAAVLLIRGLKPLAAGVPALWASSYSSAHEIGYAFGQLAVPVLFIVASAGFVVLGLRRMPPRESV